MPKRLRGQHPKVPVVDEGKDGMHLLPVSTIPHRLTVKIVLVPVPTTGQVDRLTGSSLLLVHSRK